MRINRIGTLIGLAVGLVVGVVLELANGFMAFLFPPFLVIGPVCMVVGAAIGLISGR